MSDSDRGAMHLWRKYRNAKIKAEVSATFAARVEVEIAAANPNLPSLSTDLPVKPVEPEKALPIGSMSITRYAVSDEQALELDMLKNAKKAKLTIHVSEFLAGQIHVLNLENEKFIFAATNLETKLEAANAELAAAVATSD